MMAFDRKGLLITLMTNIEEVSHPATEAENDLYFDAFPRRQSDRRKKTNSTYFMPEQAPLENKSEEAITVSDNSFETSIYERRVEERRRSLPSPFMSVEEIIELRK